METPVSQGYYMPAEWESHEGTWLQWPHDDTHENSQMRLEHLWLAMTAALHQHESVHIIVPDDRRCEHIQHQLEYYGIDLSNINIYIIPTNDVWVRDNGPIFLINGNGDIAITSWNFNGWGERYPYEKDRTVPTKVAEVLSVRIFKAPITLEGGAIEVNGKGLMIATRSSIINSNRNPGKNQVEIEETIKQHLGLKHIIWLSGADRKFCDSVKDATDFHIDEFARFVNESTVLFCWTSDETHPFYPYLKRHREELENAKVELGIPLNLVALPLPENKMFATWKLDSRNQNKLAPSLALYANFYIGNGVVLMPVYGDVNDSRVLGVLAEYFPEREIIALPAQVIAELGGMMHCVTQQQPAKHKPELPLS